MNASSKAEPKPFTGVHMLIIMVAFFGVVIAVNVVLAVLSSTSWTGLVVENSYVASQEFQGKLDALRSQQALGWTHEFSYADGTARLVVTDARGQRVDLGAGVELQFNRPIGDSQDQTLKMARAADGSYTAGTELKAGAWDAVVLAPDTPAGYFEMNQRIVAK
jgi:nitrogen fixation protein FixH